MVVSGKGAMCKISSVDIGEPVGIHIFKSDCGIILPIQWLVCFQAPDNVALDYLELRLKACGKGKTDKFLDRIL